MKKLLLFVLILSLPVFYLLYQISIDINDPLKDENKSHEEQSQITPKTIGELTTHVWIPYWDYDRGLKTLENNPGKFESISPVIYELEKDGSLKETKPGKWQELQEYAKDENIEFIPSIAMFDHELFTPILQNEDNFNRHIDAIIDAIKDKDFDGIDLDYESTKLSDEDQYKKFVQELYKRIRDLEQENNKTLTLSITVLAQWGPEVLYPSLSETRAVQDWEFLADYSDQIRIMAYDYTSQYSKSPGPIAPIEWMETVLAKAVEQIPREKIILGIPNYGYNWAASAIDPNVNFLNNPPTDKIQADAYTYDHILAIQDKYEGSDELNHEWQERVYTYKRDGNDRVLIYLSGEEIKARQALAANYSIQGVAYWRLGGDIELDY